MERNLPDEKINLFDKSGSVQPLCTQEIVCIKNLKGPEQNAKETCEWKWSFQLESAQQKYILFAYDREECYTWLRVFRSFLGILVEDAAFENSASVPASDEPSGQAHLESKSLKVETHPSGEENSHFESSPEVSPLCKPPRIPVKKEPAALIEPEIKGEQSAESEN